MWVEANLFMKTFKIKNRLIGGESPPLVIAELGINHGGSLTVAKEMVDAASSSGAEMIKHQTHVVEDEMSAVAKTVIPGNADTSIYDIMAECALCEAEELELKGYVESKGMIFISTPFSRAAADRLESWGVPAYKVGSGECNNYPLIEHIARFGKPMIVSTGMNTVESVRKTVEIMERFGVDYALLHTTNLYPTPPELVRLGGMQALMTAFPEIPVGLSDHTTSNLACFAAVALGACILERHYTDSMMRKGPDIVNSMDSCALEELMSGVQDISKMLGGIKGPAKEEQVTIDFAFATVVTIAPVAAGDVFSKDNLWVKRPGTGKLPASSFESVLGTRATRDLPADVHLNPGDFSV